MPTEIEAKFRCRDVAALRRRLRDSGATCAGQVCEHNEIYDTPQGTLRTTDCGLRLRVATPLADSADGPPTATTPAAPRVTLTYKGPRSADALKSREELETTVGDADAMRTLLARLGYVPRVVFEKRRETWHSGGATIELDELPRLGHWIEIEAGAAATVESVRAMLGLTNEPLVSETYVELAARAGEGAPGHAATLTFE